VISTFNPARNYNYVRCDYIWCTSDQKLNLALFVKRGLVPDDVPFREERIPTRCNNIDDLLSISDVDY